MERLTLQLTITAAANETVVERLAAEANLSKGQIKDALQKGAVWLRRGKSGLRRVRRATTLLKRGDYLELHYDAEVLAAPAPLGICLYDAVHYSIWHKPAGLLSQGTKLGDHASLLRQAERHWRPPRPVFLVHRLDREASGLLLLAHSKTSAARFSHLFARGAMVKEYRVRVKGNLTLRGQAGVIDMRLDGKEAVTEYTVRAYDPASATTLVDVRLRTGRLHQIRRHFTGLGYPVIGDPRYGRGNKDDRGLSLVAAGLRFTCPFTNTRVELFLPDELMAAPCKETTAHEHD